MAKFAEAIGVKPKNLSLDQVAKVFQEHKASEDAKKSAEERLAETSKQLESLSGENETLLALIGKQAEEKFNSLSDEAKGFVSEFAGDSATERLRYMTSENFQKMVAKQAPRTQGSVQNAPDAASPDDVDAEYERKFDEMMSTRDQARKRELSQELQRMGKKSRDSLYSQAGKLPVK